jgi:hypothetical protein
MFLRWGVLEVGYSLPLRDTGEVKAFERFCCPSPISCDFFLLRAWETGMD